MITWFFIILLFRDSKVWNTSGIEGVHRFLGRTWRLIVGAPLPNGAYSDGTVVVDGEPTVDQLRSLHRCIDKVISQLSLKLPFSLLFHFTLSCWAYCVVRMQKSFVHTAKPILYCFNCYICMCYGLWYCSWVQVWVQCPSCHHFISSNIVVKPMFKWT